MHQLVYSSGLFSNTPTPAPAGTSAGENFNVLPDRMFSRLSQAGETRSSCPDTLAP